MWAPDSRRVALSDRRGVLVVSLLRPRPKVVLATARLGVAPSWSPDGRQLAVAASSGRPAQDDVFVVSPDGRHARSVVALPLGRSVGFPPVWSRNSRRLYFSVQSSQAAGPTALHTMLPNGRDERAVLGSETRRMTQPAWSPDGRRIGVAGSFGGHGFEIGILRPRTGRLQRVAMGEWPAWSPDGSRLVLERDGALYLHTFATGRERRLPGAGGTMVQPAWSPDGRVLAFAAVHGSGTTIDVMRPDGSGRRTVAAEPETCPAARQAFRPSWSPDGRRIVFSETDGSLCGTRSLYLASLVVVGRDGRDRRVLLDGRGLLPCDASSVRRNLRRDRSRLVPRRTPGRVHARARSPAAVDRADRRGRSRTPRAHGRRRGELAAAPGLTRA